MLLPLIESLDKVSCTTIKICMVNGEKFVKEVKRNQVCFAIIPRKLSFFNKSQVPKNSVNRVPVSSDRVIDDSIDRVPEEIAEFLNENKDIVADDILDGLPLVRSISHFMDLIPRASLPNKAPYKLTPTENKELNCQVHKLLQKGLIRESLSPCVVSIVLTLKKNGEWRMCTNSRASNKITVKYRFPMPMMDDIMDCFSGAKYFTKINLKSDYHQIKIRE